MEAFSTNYIIPIIIIVLVAAAYFDLRTQRIPNFLTLPMFLIALIFHVATKGTAGFTFFLAGTSAGVGLLLLPYLMGGIGTGEAKLMGAVGAVVGAKGAFIAFIFSGIAGGIYTFFFVVLKRRQYQGYFKQRLLDIQLLILTKTYISNTTKPAARRLCYGLAIALGSITYIFLDQNG